MNKICVVLLGSILLVTNPLVHAARDSKKRASTRIARTTRTVKNPKTFSKHAVRGFTSVRQQKAKRTLSLLQRKARTAGLRTNRSKAGRFARGGGAVGRTNSSRVGRARKASTAGNNRGHMAKRAALAAYQGRRSTNGGKAPSFRKGQMEISNSKTPVMPGPFAPTQPATTHRPAPAMAPEVKPASTGKNEITIGKTRIRAVKGDITKQKVDAIVNAANEELQAGSGVCGAIFAAAGKEELQKACNKVPLVNDMTQQRCRTGDAKITPSFNLKKQGISHIIHAVGPDCRAFTDDQDQIILLRAAYRRSLELADAQKLKSIAFPSISTGVYEFPKERATRGAVELVNEYLRNNKNTSLTDIVFVFTSDDGIELFNKALMALNSK